MKRVLQSARPTALAVILAAGTGGTVYAQQGGTSGTSTGTGASTGTGTSSGSTASDSRSNWGWLGLIGLVGLAPLFNRRNGHAGSSNSGMNRNGSH